MLDLDGRLLELIAGPEATTRSRRPPVIGVLEGEGVGPEVIAVALRVLDALRPLAEVSVRFGGAIGRLAEKVSGRPLSDEAITFCEGVFAEGGALLCGPGGGRFVYDLRRRFDLFCKISPLAPATELAGAIRMRPEHVRDLDLVVVRENCGGIYQGRWGDARRDDGTRVAEHAFDYTEPDVQRIVGVGARCAAARRGVMTVVVKDGGIPAVSQLFRACGEAAAKAAGVKVAFADIDLASYLLVQRPRELDVIVASNLFGDVLGDLGGVLVGSRGLTFSGNFNAGGAAVYQTNHGAAYDLAGTDRSNPVGQVYSLAMLLRESFGLAACARIIEEAIRAVWKAGFRTDDLIEPDGRVIGTREMGDRLIEAVRARVADRSEP